jgi:hypothetical protein
MQVSNTYGQGLHRAYFDNPNSRFIKCGLIFLKQALIFGKICPADFADIIAELHSFSAYALCYLRAIQNHYQEFITSQMILQPFPTLQNGEHLLPNPQLLTA